MNADPEQIEFLLSQVPDGTLSAEEQQSVKAALAADPALLALAAKYVSLAALINKIKATRISIDDAAMADCIRDGLQAELEYQISQDMDGLLDVEASQQLGKVIASSHALQSREQTYRDVQRLLDRYGSAQPAIDIDAMSARIRSTIRKEAVRETVVPARRADRPHAYRIAAWFTPVAAAAALLIAVFAWRSGTPDTGGPPGPSPAPTPSVTVIVREPAAQPAGSVTVEYDMSEQVAATESEGGIIISSGAQRERDPGKERRRTATALLHTD